jgi:hypothetical protein
LILQVSDQTGELIGQLGSNYEDCQTCYPAAQALNGVKDDLWPPTITGVNPKAWISITLPETLVIAKVKAFTYEVKHRIKTD